MSDERMPEPGGVESRLVYVAGPMETSGTVGENLRKASECAAKLIRSGYFPIVPHFSWLIEMIDPAIHRGLWMAVDKWAIVQCRALIRLEGVSVGAAEEVQHAFNYGISVWSSVEAFLNSERIKSEEAERTTTT
jgi:hypothetical protein